MGTGNKLRERLHPRPSPPEPQPPQGARQRQRSGSRERENPHEQAPHEPQVQPTATPESDDEISDEDFTIIYPSSQSAGLQLNKGIAPEGSKDPGHVSDYIHVHPRMHINNNSLLHLLQELNRGNSERRWTFSNRGSTESCE